MSTQSVVLTLASYSDPAVAARGLERAEEVAVALPAPASSVGLHRLAEGRVIIVRPGGGTATGTALLADHVGVVLGLTMPPLLISPLVSAEMGTALRRQTREHAEGRLGMRLSELRPGCHATAVLSQVGSGGDVRRALSGADRITVRPVKPFDLAEVRASLTAARHFGGRNGGDGRGTVGERGHGPVVAGVRRGRRHRG